MRSQSVLALIVVDLDAERVWEFQKEGSGLRATVNSRKIARREESSRIRGVVTVVRGASDNTSRGTGTRKTVKSGWDSGVLRDRCVSTAAMVHPPCPETPIFYEVMSPLTVGTPNRGHFFISWSGTRAWSAWSTNSTPPRIRRTVQVPSFKTRIPPSSL